MIKMHIAISFKRFQAIYSGLTGILNTQTVSFHNFQQGFPHSASIRLRDGRLSQVVQQKVKYSTKHEEIIFRQLFHHDSYTYTYILGCPITRNAVIIDPVNEMVERDIKVTKEMKLNLLYGLNTHVHADHVTGTGNLKRSLPNFKSIISKVSGAKADIFVEHGDEIKLGEKLIKCRATPGHTNGCMTYVLPAHRMAFTGDALLIRACGRTDFQEGSPDVLYDSIHKQIFDLDDDYLLYPGHDYQGFTVTTVAEEKQHNPRLTLSKEKFIQFMKDLNLAYPKLIDVSVPANLKCGEISRQSVLGTEELLKK